MVVKIVPSANGKMHQAKANAKHVFLENIQANLALQQTKAVKSAMPGNIP